MWSTPCMKYGGGQSASSSCVQHSCVVSTILLLALSAAASYRVVGKRAPAVEVERRGAALDARRGAAAAIIGQIVCERHRRRALRPPVRLVGVPRRRAVIREHLRGDREVRRLRPSPAALLSLGSAPGLCRSGAGAARASTAPRPASRAARPSPPAAARRPAGTPQPRLRWELRLSARDLRLQPARSRAWRHVGDAPDVLCAGQPRQRRVGVRSEKGAPRVVLFRRPAARRQQRTPGGALRRSASAAAERAGSGANIVTCSAE